MNFLQSPHALSVLGSSENWQQISIANTADLILDPIGGQDNFVCPAIGEGLLTSWGNLHVRDNFFVDRKLRPSDSIPDDVRQVLINGGYKVVVREKDGEQFVFPITEPEIIDSKDITDETTDASQAGGWQGVKIPQIYCDVGTWQWIKTDDFILHMKRPFLSDDHHENYVGRFSFDPETMEFLPSVISMPHNDSIRSQGSRPFNYYMRGIYVRDKKVLLLKAYYNPLNEKNEFDPEKLYDHDLDRSMTTKTLEMLARNGLPKDLLIIVHANNDDVGKYTRYK